MQVSMAATCCEGLTSPISQLSWHPCSRACRSASINSGCLQRGGQAIVTRAVMWRGDGRKPLAAGLRPGLGGTCGGEVQRRRREALVVSVAAATSHEDGSVSHSSDVATHDHSHSPSPSSSSSSSSSSSPSFAPVTAAAAGDGEAGGEAAAEVEDEASSQSKRRKSLQQLQNRVVFGTLVGVVAFSGLLAGGWWFTTGLGLIGGLGAWEYFGLVAARAKRRGETSPGPIAVLACCAMCAAMPLMTMYFEARVGVAVAAAAALLATILLLSTVIKNRFKLPQPSEVSSLVFGLFYCGYLPSFWIKLRSGLPSSFPSPTIHTPLAQLWPAAWGGPAHWTVGLVSTFIAFAAIIAADSGAYVGGKTFGRTKLIDISPKKTREGAAVGLLSAVAIAILLSRAFRFPTSILSAATLGILIFLASIFGDLAESVLKRDAGVKDAGSIIPGHGGILDRTDSYIFTGALVYSFIKVALPV